jgi:hypothetical protein
MVGPARIIHIFEDNKSLLCYKHVVETLFAVTKEASECLTIAQHSVCCSQEFFASLSLPSSISERGVPTAEPCWGRMPPSALRTSRRRLPPLRAVALRPVTVLEVLRRVRTPTRGNERRPVGGPMGPARRDPDDRQAARRSGRGRRRYCRATASLPSVRPKRWGTTRVPLAGAGRKGHHPQRGSERVVFGLPCLENKSVIRLPGWRGEEGRELVGRCPRHLGGWLSRSDPEGRERTVDG